MVALLEEAFGAVIRVSFALWCDPVEVGLVGVIVEADHMSDAAPIPSTPRRFSLKLPFSRALFN